MFKGRFSERHGQNLAWNDLHVPYVLDSGPSAPPRQAIIGNFRRKFLLLSVPRGTRNKRLARGRLLARLYLFPGVESTLLVDGIATCDLALPTETKIESGTTQSNSGTSVDLSESC